MKNSWVYLVIGALIVLLILHWFKKPVPTDDSLWVAKLDSLEKIIQARDSSIIRKDLEYKELQASKDKIRIVLKDRLVYLDKASLVELDSVIRSIIK